MIKNPELKSVWLWLNQKSPYEQQEQSKRASRKTGLSLAVALSILGLGFSSLTRAGDLRLDDSNPLAMPAVGSYGLRVLSPTLLELTLITTKNPDPVRVTQWDFVDNFQLTPPSTQEFVVSADGQPVNVQRVGFKRRALYAPLKNRDLRLGNYLYLELDRSIADGQSVEVKNPSGKLWADSTRFVAVADPLRLSPAIHVNEVGYLPAFSKKAMVGYYVGSLGEMKVPASAGFKVVEAVTGHTVYQGQLVARLDKGYSMTPTPYQAVFEADFTAFQTPGEYRLVVPGLGASFRFLIDEGVGATFARTYALGLYHQRCGMANDFPFTRHRHDACHLAMADIPTIEYQKTQQFLAEVSSDVPTGSRQTAPQLKDVNASLYPFVNQGKIDVSGGHHDAGDYSKYTINSSALVHYLIFAADAFKGVGELDNLGLPESGDGKSDLLQEAKWEADFLAKLQDADGGFYFLVYPRDRQYEDNVLPDHGDPQVVWPKTTSVTAAAVAALAEAGSSPLFKKQFPAEAALYLEKAQRGWAFLEKAIADHGKDGAYQKITHYGNEFMHDDELAWAAAALFAATGDSLYHDRLKAWLVPGSVQTRRWNWWRMFEGYGCAIRTYAFAARTGRLTASQLDPIYLAKCEAEIQATASDHVRFARECAYGTSFPGPSKGYRTAGWYFSSERAFDLTVAYQIQPRPEYLETIIGNMNYEAGSNPVNVSYITGLGWKRQRDIVHQYAQNDRRVLPPTGVPLGNIQAGFQYLNLYKQELGALNFPADGTATAPYPFYDRWGDSFNTTTEFVIVDQARSLANLAFVMALTSVKDQPWRAGIAQITGLPVETSAEQTLTATVLAPGIDLSRARIVWEARDLEPQIASTLTFAAKYPGQQWVEAEVQLPDGRRLFAATNFNATFSPTLPPNNFQSAPLAPSSETIALFHLDDDSADATGRNGNLNLLGRATLDTSNLGWMANRSGQAIKVNDLDDRAVISIPGRALYPGPQTAAITLEAMIYIHEFKAFNRSTARLLSLYESWNSFIELREDAYAGPQIKGGGQFSFDGPTLKQALKTKEWLHFSITLDQTGYIVRINGATITAQPSGDLANWANNSSAKLEFGNFDGWIDEVVIKNSGGASTGPEVPSVSLVAPTDASIFTGFADITLTANAVSLAGGGIAKVEFFQGLTKIGEAVSTPYTATWNAVPPGLYSLTAKATDKAGFSTVSFPTSISVVGLPAIVLAPGISPSGGSFSGPVTVTLTSATAGSRIRYTTNGSEPSETSTEYVIPFTLSNTATIKAKAYKSGMANSSITIATLNINSDNSAPNQATFVKADITTQGNWKTLYGNEGYRIMGDSTAYPAYAKVVPNGQSEYTWTASTTDARALLKGSGAGRVAGASYSDSVFTLDMNLIDGRTHRVAFYFLDWDRVGRSESVELLDADSGALLSQQTVSAFQEGKYLVWDLKGHVTVRLKPLAGPNAVLMGTFFDPVPTTAVKPPALLRPIGRLPDGNVQLRLTGEAGKVYRIEASSDLQNWTSIATQTLINAEANIVDPESNRFSGRFYRATPAQ